MVLERYPRRRRNSVEDEEPREEGLSDLEEDSSGEDSDDSLTEIELPPDPAHEARMAALRAENAQLIEQRELEDQLLQQEIARRDEILERVRWMERRRQILRENCN